MIARIWRGRTTATLAESYMPYLQQTGLPDYSRTPGFEGAYVLTRTEHGETELVLLTLWRDMEAVRAFAGAEPERAVYYPEDHRYFPEREERVLHFDASALPPPALGATATLADFLIAREAR